MSATTKQNSLKTTPGSIQRNTNDENVTLMLLLSYNKMRLFAESLETLDVTNQKKNRDAFKLVA